MDKVAKNLTRLLPNRADIKSIKFEVAQLAKFSDGSCTCSLGDSSVLVTAVSRTAQNYSTQNFVPLSVEYKQKAAACGRIPMTHLRRDVGIIEREVLIGRMIDKSIRPAFSEGFRDDTQIICNLLAVDGSNDPDVLAINGASASLAISHIPWNGPIGAVRIGLIGEKLVANPVRKEQENSRLNMVMAANSLGNIMMIDGTCKEPVPTQDVVKALRQGVKECKVIIETIKQLQLTNGKPKRPENLVHLPTLEHKEFVLAQSKDKLGAVFSDFTHDKISRDHAIKAIRDEVLSEASENFPEVHQSILDKAFINATRVTYRSFLTQKRIRCDGRKFNQVRPISCKVDLYKPLHGSALFQRGQTQVFCSATFDSPDAAFRTDSITSMLSGIKEKNFMLHYEFPPFATNEIGRVGAMPNRREIGHGALAEKAIVPVVPEDLDMTIRLNCEVLESNGSSSMASVCAGSMSLMDAGVQLKEHVAGVAMGLISDSGENEAGDGEKSTDSGACVLTDILGFEDYIGDMDFKIAGTKKAITALQLDVKPQTGVPLGILSQALDRAQTARSKIITKMESAIKEPRTEKKANHPVMKTIFIPPHKISYFVGFGGSNLKRMMAEIGVRISALGDTASNELGSMNRHNFIIFAPNCDAMLEAEEYIKSLFERVKEPELEFNGIYTATVEEIRPNGVMVTLYSNMKPTLLPLSQLDVKTVSHPSALNMEIGQQLQVKYFGRDPATGQMRLSRKSLMMSGVARTHRSPIA